MNINFYIVELVPIILNQLDIEFFSQWETLSRSAGEIFEALVAKRETNHNSTVNKVQKNSQALRIIGDINVKSIAGIVEGEVPLSPTQM